jgi:two-component system, OmpR family, phosphate regulon sensor histidine kinase PhoR
VQNNFTDEIQRFLFLGAISCFIGLIIDELLFVLLFFCIAYLWWNLHQIKKLEKWLRNNKLALLPDAGGIWGDIFDYLSRDKKRQLKEKKRLKTVINRVETMTSALNDAVILLNKDYTIGWLNKPSRSLLNLKRSDVGNPITNFIRHPSFVNYLYKGDHEIPLILPAINNEEKRLEFRLNHFGDGEGLLIVRDASRMYRLEQMRKDFVANVSHELRTPLTVILGYLETLSDTQQESDPWKKPVQQMQQQATRMTTLINDLTMLSKLETEEINKQPNDVYILPLLRMVVDEVGTVHQQRETNITIECPENWMIRGSEKELHSAFSNLVMNAVKYSPPDSSVIVKVSKNFVGGIDVKVIDNGYGIEQQHIHRLTERFYRVDASRSIETGGTGLGLAIVKHILARHDARLNISSRINQGSTFSAIFPKGRATTDT